MKTMLIFIGLIMVFSIMSAQASTGGLIIEFDNPAMTREERMVKLQVDKFKKIDLTVHEKQYIGNPLDAIAEQEYAEKVQRINGLKPGESYSGR